MWHVHEGTNIWYDVNVLILIIIKYFTYKNIGMCVYESKTLTNVQWKLHIHLWPVYWDDKNGRRSVNSGVLSCISCLTTIHESRGFRQFYNSSAIFPISDCCYTVSATGQCMFASAKDASKHIFRFNLHVMVFVLKTAT